MFCDQFLLQGARHTSQQIKGILSHIYVSLSSQERQHKVPQHTFHTINPCNLVQSDGNELSGLQSEDAIKQAAAEVINGCSDSTFLSILRGHSC